MRRQAEQADGYFLVEGSLALQAALASPYRVLSVLVLPRRLPALLGLGVPPEVPVYTVDDHVLAATTGFDVHRGILAVAARSAAPTVAELLRDFQPQLILIVEDLRDQENLGSLFRNAAAFGAGAVLLSPACCDPLYRRTVRVSLGHVLRVPFARLEPWPAALKELVEQGYALVALTPRAGAERVEDVAGRLHGSRVALLVGTEGAGLSGPALAAAQLARIAIAPGVDSLNVAAASAVALHRFASVA